MILSQYAILTTQYYKRMNRKFLIAVLALLSVTTLISATEKSKTKKAKNVILLIGDGMGLSQISYGLITSTNRMNLERFKCVGLSKTSSSQQKITDSAAGATAFSCGKKTYNGAVAVDDNRQPIKTILEIAEEKNYATGLVATCAITHATPAAFIAHQPSREMYEEIAADFLKTDIDLFIGGGLDNFQKRKDGRDLTKDLQSKDYSIITDQNNLWEVKEQKKIAALIAPKHLAKMQEGRGDYLPKASEFAVNQLNKKGDGFFLMIEGSQIDWGGHANDAEYIRQELMDFDITIGKILDFAEKDGNTLVIVTADHETGGFALSGNEDKDGNIYPAFTSKNHSASAVPVFAYGPGAEEFMGIYENNTIFDKMIKAFGF
jgi:alkaline phosphatase